ncbi:Crotonobetainyl-CoA:carnitine CoA-transferase CaiB [Eubacterium maltosivorans]|uniref:CaiB/BaiF CoA transferase family protein n=1 Tax=Eubacterium TaxID=1730 RepID=UPI000880B667|nr:MULTISPECIES: CaiB/BaiF CoA-transferase family protein [Eubacterium]WPK80883.1 Succinyl-CoA--L-malate CoA-transferase beta subunit [Eubacterium maltosivorans]SDP74894.1 Crotonobetainyl-CoA:carnitine CoA-transferase CaiB [Eubacterium maltosivorans]
MTDKREEGALEGLKILDFSTLLPGPFATTMLADLGAEVLKISGPGKPDIVLDYPPFIEGTTVSANQTWLGRNKKTMLLNLKKPGAVEVVKKLIMEYDIVMEQFRPGVMEKLGLGYEALAEINPRLIYCSLTGYGQTGPLSHRAGHDINYLARSGNMAQAGRAETGPVLTNMQVADVAVGSMNSVIGILAAVQYRNRTGKGQRVDIAMLDGLIPFNGMDGTAFLAAGKVPKREGERLNGGCIYDFYETKDGQYLSVGALEPKFWAEFCHCIGREDLIEGSVWPEDVKAVKEVIRGILKEKTRDEWMAVFDGRDVCVEPVLSVQEALLEDVHIRAREMVVEVELPLSDGKKVPQYGTAVKLSESPAQYRFGGYPVGYHTEAVLKALGCSDDAIESLTSI